MNPRIWVGSLNRSLLGQIRERSLAPFNSSLCNSELKWYMSTDFKVKFAKDNVREKVISFLCKYNLMQIRLIQRQLHNETQTAQSEVSKDDPRPRSTGPQ